MENGMHNDPYVPQCSCNVKKEGQVQTLWQLPLQVWDYIWMIKVNNYSSSGS
jgi:hypothetical protein